MSKQKPAAAELQKQRVISKLIEEATFMPSSPKPSAQAAPSPSPPPSADDSVQPDSKTEKPGQSKSRSKYFWLSLALDPGLKDFYSVYRALYPEKSRELLNETKKFFIRELERAYQEDEVFRSLVDKSRRQRTG